MVTSIEHLDFIISHANSTMDYFDAKKHKELPLFCIGMIERLLNGSKSIILLLQNIEKEPGLEFSCGIILRSLILDALSVFNLFHIMAEDSNYKNETEKFAAAEEFCASMLSDGLEHTLKYIKMAKDVNMISQEIQNKTYENFASKYINFFEPYPKDGSKPVLRNTNHYSPKDLFRRLATTPKLKELSKIYDSYIYYSKYDHFGILYYEVSRQPSNKKIEKIEGTIEIFVGCFSMIHAVLADYLKDDFLNTQAGSAEKYLFDNVLKRK